MEDLNTGIKDVEIKIVDRKLCIHNLELACDTWRRYWRAEYCFFWDLSIVFKYVKLNLIIGIINLKIGIRDIKIEIKSLKIGIKT